MPRRAKSPTLMIVNYFMSAGLSEAKQALDTAKAIVSSREAAGLQQPNLPVAPKTRRRRGPNKPKQGDLPVPGSPAATTGTAGPVAVPDAPKPRRRRGAGQRPVVADTATAATAATAPLPPVPSGVDLASLPPPSE